MGSGWGLGLGRETYVTVSHVMMLSTERSREAFWLVGKVILRAMFGYVRHALNIEQRGREDLQVTEAARARMEAMIVERIFAG